MYYLLLGDRFQEAVAFKTATERSDLPEQAIKEHKTTYRSLTVNGKEIEFSGGFTDLHTQIYMDILQGGGFRPSDTRNSTELAYAIRHAKIQKPGSLDAHPMA